VKEASLATYMSSFVKEEPQEPKQQQPLLNTTTSSAPLVIQGHQHHNQQQQYHRQHQYHTENDKVYFPTSPSTYHPGHQQQQQQQQHAHTQEQQQQQQQTPLSQYLHPLQPTHYPLKQQQQQQREEEEEQQIPIENNIERKHRNHNQQEQESYYSNELEPKNIRLTIKTHNESDNGMSAESAAIVFPTAIATTHSRNDGDDDDDYVPNTPTSATVPTTPNVQRICVICNTPNTSKRQKWYTTSSFIDDYKKCFQIDQVTPGDVCEPCYQKCYRFRKQNSSGVITSKKKGLSKSAASQNGHKKDGPSFGKRRRKESKNSPDALYELVDETTDYNDEEFVVENQNDEDFEPVGLLKRTPKKTRRQQQEATQDAHLTPGKLKQKTSDSSVDMVEVFIDFWTKANFTPDATDHQQSVDEISYKRDKVVREIVPSNICKTDLLDVVRYYCNLLFKDGKYVTKDIKLAEKDACGSDLHIDLVPDQCFDSNPVKPKNRFIAFVDLRENDS